MIRIMYQLYVPLARRNPAKLPYAVYSHMKRQGEAAYQGERACRKAAYNRFEDDLRNLQNERENQRDQFFGNIKEEQMLE